MQAFLDDDKLTLEAPSIAAAVDAARAEAERRGRIIIDVLADGSSIDGSLLEEPPSDAAGISELRMVTADPASFISVTLSDAADALEEARATQKQAATLIQQGDTDGAAEPIAAALGTWSVIRDVVEKSSRLADLDPGGTTATLATGETVTGAACIEQLAEHLTTLREHLMGSDWVSLADVLAYDLDELAERWIALLRAMSASVSG